jgi:hypothetical protein
VPVAAPADAPQRKTAASVAGTVGSHTPPTAPSVRIAAILASGAPAALVPVATTPDSAAPRALVAPVVRRPLDAKTAARTHRGGVEPSPAGHGDGKAPPPAGPPGSASAGASGAASSGLSSAQWGVIVLVLLALAGQELRRLRLRPTLSPAAGFTPLLQRPG